MDDTSNLAKRRSLSLLRFLSDKIPNCQVEKGTLKSIVGHIVSGLTHQSSEAHDQILSELEAEAVLTGDTVTYTLNGHMIPDGTVAMSNDDVLELLLAAINISGLITAAAPNKAIFPVMWTLLLDFTERHRSQPRASY